MRLTCRHCQESEKIFPVFKGERLDTKAQSRVESHAKRGLYRFASVQYRAIRPACRGRPQNKQSKQTDLRFIYQKRNCRSVRKTQYNQVRTLKQRAQNLSQRRFGLANENSRNRR